MGSLKTKGGLFVSALSAASLLFESGCSTKLDWSSFGLSDVPKIGQLKVTPSATPATAGQCVDLTLTFYELDGTTSALTPAIVPVTLDSLLGGSTQGTFYDGAGCASSATTSITVPSGLTTYTASFQATIMGDYTISADGLVWQINPLALHINPDVAYPFTSSLVAQTSAITATDSVTASLITLTVKDQYGNIRAGDPVTWFTPSSGAVIIDPLSAFTDASGVATNHLASSSSGNKVLQVTLPVALSTLSAQVTFGSSPIYSQISLSPLSSTANAGDCIDYTITTKDQFGAVLSTTDSFDLTTISGSGSFYAGSGCPGGTVASVSTAVSSTALFSYKPFTAQAPTASTILVHPNGVSSDQIASITVSPGTTPGGAPLSTLTPSIVSGIPADNVSTSTLTLNLKDLYGNTMPNTTVALSVTGGTLGSSSVTTNASGIATTTLKSGIPGTATVLLVGATPTVSANVTFSQPFDHLAVTAPASFTAGTCQPVTINSQDVTSAAFTAYGSAIGPISLSGSAGGAFYLGSDTGCTGTAQLTTSIAVGLSSVTVNYKATLAGATSQSVTATYPSIGYTSNTFIINADNPTTANTTLTVSQVGPTLYDNGVDQALISGTLKDQFGNAVLNRAFTLSFSPATGIATTPAGPSYSSDASGNFAVNFTVSAGNFGAKSVTLTSTMSKGPSTITFTASPHLDHLALSTGTTGTVATCQNITVTAKDQFNSTFTTTATDDFTLSLGTGTGNFYLGSGCPASPITTATFPSGASTLALSFIPSSPVPVQLKTSGGTPTPLTAATFDITTVNQSTFAEGTPQSSITATATTGVPADNVATTTLTFTLKDTFGNLLTSFPFNVTTNLGTLGQTSLTTNGSGVATTTLKASTAGIATVSLVGVTPATSLAITFVPPFSSLQVAISNSFVAGTCNLMTISAYDTTPAPFTVYGSALGPIALSDLPVQGAYFLSTDTSCTGAVQTTTSIPVGQTSVQVRYRNTVAAGSTVQTQATYPATPYLSPAITVVPDVADATQTTLSLTAVGATLYANNADYAQVTGFLKDQFGNPLPSTSYTPAVNIHLGGTDTFATLAPVSGWMTNVIGQYNVLFKSSLSGTKDVTISSAPMVKGPAFISFNPPPQLDHLELTTTTTPNIASCNDITVAAIDQYGGPYTLSTSESFNVGFNFGSGTYYANAGCTGGVVTGRTMSSGTSSITMSYVPNSLGPTELRFYAGSPISFSMDAIFDVTVSGSGAPILSVSDSPSYDFGTWSTSTTVDKIVFVTNTSNTDDATNFSVSLASGGGISFKGGTYPGFGGNCPTLGGILPKQVTCAIILRFTPFAGSLSGANLQITYNYSAFTGLNQTLNFTGSGTSGVSLAITDYPPAFYSDYGIPTDPATFDWGGIGYGTSQIHPFYVQNRGSVAATLQATPAVVSPDQNMGSTQYWVNPGGTCTSGLVLAPGATCVVPVAWIPDTSPSTLTNTTLTVYALSGYTATRALTGTPVGGLAPGAPSMHIDDYPINLGFGAGLGGLSIGNSLDLGPLGSQGSHLFIVRNTGNYLMNLGLPAVSGPGFILTPTPVASNYDGTHAIPNGNDLQGHPYCGGDLNPGESCGVEVTFDPSLVGPAGIYTGTVMVGGVTRNVKATKITTALLQISSVNGGGGSSLNDAWGDVPINTDYDRYYKITNAGISLAGGMFASDPGMGFT